MGTRKYALPIVAGLFAAQLACDRAGPTELTASGGFSLTAITPTTISGVVRTKVVPEPAVRIVDKHGQGVAGVAVSVLVERGGGSLQDISVVTDSDGTAKVAWTLGPRVGINTLVVRTPHLGPVRFEGASAAGPLARMIAVGGEGQVGVRASVLRSPLSVRLSDAFDNAVAGVPVRFSVATGLGTIEGADAISNAEGIATSGRWTLGPSLGPQTVQVQAGPIHLTFVAESVGCPPAPPCSFNGDVVYTQLTDRQLYRISMDGTGLTRLTASGWNERPVSSPDGQRIAFIRSAEGNPGTSDVFIMNVDGSNVVRRTTDGRWRSATWSPDGRTLALSTEGVYYSDVAVIGVDQGGWVHLAKDARSPAWSPDGQQIAFVRVSGDDGYDEIFVMNKDGSRQRALTSHAGGLYGVTWSPDGQHLAFSRCQQGSCDLYRMNADGSGMRQLTVTGNVQGAAWSPDGAWIAVTASRYSGTSWHPTVAYVPAAGGTPRAVADGFWPSWLR